ncbi:MAG TPA: hypothetical protein VGA49_02055 [Patescibacteria group bacterium]
MSKKSSIIIGILIVIVILAIGWFFLKDKIFPGVITPEAGGTVVSSDGRLKLAIPAGAVSEKVRIKVSPAVPGPGLEFAEDVYELSPSGLEFLKPVIISLTLDQTDSEEGQLAGEIQLLYSLQADGTIEPLAEQALEFEEGGQAVVNGQLSHFSEVLRAPTGVSVTLTGVPDVIQVDKKFLVNVTVVKKVDSEVFNIDQVTYRSNGEDPIIFWEDIRGFAPSRRQSDLLIGRRLTEAAGEQIITKNDLRHSCVAPAYPNFNSSILFQDIQVTLGLLGDLEFPPVSKYEIKGKKKILCKGDLDKVTDRFQQTNIEFELKVDPANVSKLINQSFNITISEKPQQYIGQVRLRLADTNPGIVSAPRLADDQSEGGTFIFKLDPVKGKEDATQQLELIGLKTTEENKQKLVYTCLKPGETDLVYFINEFSLDESWSFQSAPRAVSSHVRCLSEEEKVEDAASIQAIKYLDKFIPLDEVHQASPDACGEVHWHANKELATATDGAKIPDPNPFACGFGRVSEVPVVEVEIGRIGN